MKNNAGSEMKKAQILSRGIKSFNSINFTEESFNIAFLISYLAANKRYVLVNAQVCKRLLPLHRIAVLYNYN